MFKLAILWMAILLMGSFWLTMRTGSEPVSMAVIPQAPREGEPIVATFKLNNPSSQAIETEYQFYANGEFLKGGTTTIAPASGKTYKYAYENHLELGEQVNFVVKTKSTQGSYEKMVSLPSYPPQVWSSFVSFASFSTSVMSSFSSMTYYQINYGGEMGLNIGLIVAIVLIGLLIFFELTKPSLGGKTVATLGRLRMRFSTVIWILLIIFLSMVYTKVVMILAA